MPENAYQPPETDPRVDSTRIRQFGFGRTLWLLVYLYPLMVIGSLYGTWLLAWWQLGHMPQPNVDDPKSIGGLLHVGWMVPLFFFMLFPILLPLGFIASFYLLPRRAQPRVERFWWILSAIYFLFCLLVYWLLKWDPLKVVEWYGD